MTDSAHPGHEGRVDAVSSFPRRLARSPAPDFAALYDSTAEMAWRLLGRLGVAPAEQEDALQDVFVIVHRRLGEFRSDAKPSTWVSAIAVRVARDYRRRRSRKPSEDLEPHEHALVDSRPGPDAVAARAQAAAIVTTLLEQLDSDQRDVFVLVELEQHTAPDIAEMLGVPVNTVYSRLRLARAHFNELVQAFQRGA